MAGRCEGVYNAAVEGFRELEYPMLKDSVYLDHAGCPPCPKSLMDGFAADMSSTLYGNPHSASWPSQLSADRVDDIRLRLLAFFNADPAHYDLIFVSNATAAVKLVVEAMRSLPNGYLFAYHHACHTSLIGAREDATFSLCLDDVRLGAWLNGLDPFPPALPSPSAALLAFSAQSHMDGRRYPLSWANSLPNAPSLSCPLYTLLDAASLAATSPLDLSAPDHAADFTVLSLYKIFGFPDLGVLIVRRAVEAVFDHRSYFGGGTVDMVVSGPEQWHVRKTRSLHDRLEDGSLPFHSIMAVDIALKVHLRLFGSMDQVSAHTTYLTQRLCDGLVSLRHPNGRPVCLLYTLAPARAAPLGTGPVVSFNLLNAEGDWVSIAEFEKLALLKQMHLRTGGLCSPGGIASALGLEPSEMKENLSAGFRCASDNDLINGKPTGVIRASIGAMSTLSDIDRFLAFVRDFFSYHPPVLSPTAARAVHAAGSGSALRQPSLRVKSLAVYPIKSCGAFEIPASTRWELRPEGLAWDREWCLIHLGTGQALSQKRYPRMALLRPALDLEAGLLHVSYHGPTESLILDRLSIPLSYNPELMADGGSQGRARVCGEEVAAQRYTCPSINAFFSDALGVPCLLARFPPGGRGPACRLSRARMQKHQGADKYKVPGSFPGVPSPPLDTDLELRQQARILLSNESPILLVHSSSLEALNRAIENTGSDGVAEAVFRANIIVEQRPGLAAEAAYSEDHWRGIQIGSQFFQMLGACRRCQMVCIDQVTASIRQEPYSTLAKTRRVDGRVYFGVHLRHELETDRDGVAPSQPPTIQVGEPVKVDADGVEVSAVI